MKLNIGCGNDYKEGYVNLDISNEGKCDIVHNIEKGLPFKDKKFEYIYARHALEHIHQEKFLFVLSELIRILKPKGVIDIWCPHFSCGITYRELGHYTPISYFTIKSDLNIDVKKRFNFFRKSFKYKDHKNIQPILNILNPALSFIPNIMPLVYERFFCWTYPCEEVYFKVIKKTQSEKHSQDTSNKSYDQYE